MRFTSEPDGLKLGYSVTDEEMPCESPPYPAHKYRVDHSKSWSSPVGARTVENVRVVLEGPALVDRNFLCSRAFQIALSRARALTAKEFGRRLIRGLSVSESFGNDGGPILCTCEITTEHNDSVTTPGKQTTGPVMGAMDMNPIGQILTLPQPESESDPNYYDPNRMWLPGDPFGTGIGNLIYTLTALWQTPCTGDHDNRQGMAPWPPKPPVQVGIEERPSVTWQQGVPTQMEGAGINSQSIEHPYNYARIESEFHTNHGWIGLPLAAAPAEGAATIGIQVHAPTTIRVVKAFFERVGEWPIIHKAKKFTDSSGVVHWPTKTTLVSRTKEKLPDNKDLYSLNYEYVFQLDREYTDIQPLPVGVLPWDTQTQNDTRIPRTAFIEPDDNNKGLS
jgi:hypothetical protein